MNISGLRVRITIQKNETVVDKYGNHKSAWTDFFSCWASAVTSGLSASEKVRWRCPLWEGDKIVD